MYAIRNLIAGNRSGEELDKGAQMVLQAMAGRNGVYVAIQFDQVLNTWGYQASTCAFTQPPLFTSNDKHATTNSCLTYWLAHIAGLSSYSAVQAHSSVIHQFELLTLTHLAQQIYSQIRRDVVAQQRKKVIAGKESMKDMWALASLLASHYAVLPWLHMWLRMMCVCDSNDWIVQ